jgi:arabinofuranosyltransferase
MIASDRQATREVAPASKKGELVLLGTAMLLCAVCAATIYLLRDEDAFIYYRYALNWARGLGLVFNAGEPVEGYSSPCWMWIVGWIARLGWTLPVAVPALGIGCGVATVGATWRLAGHMGLDRFGRLAAASGLALSYPFLYWSRSGLETPLFSLLLVLTADLYLAAQYPPPADPARQSRLQLAGGAALALVSLARPEGMLLLPLVLADRLTDRRDWRGAARYFLPAAAGYGAYLLWRFHTYGSLVPNTSVKLYPMLAGRAAGQLGSYLIQLGLLPPLLPVLVLLDRRQQDSRRRALIFLIAVVGTFVGFHLAAGGEYRGEFRYLVPTLPILLVALWWSAERLELRWWSDRRPFASAQARLLLVVLLLICSVARIGQDLPKANEWPQLRRQWTESVDDPADWRVIASRWLADNLPDGGVVAVGQMGRIPYYLTAGGRDVAFVDTLGLVDRRVSAIYRLDHKLGALARGLAAGGSLAQALEQGRRERHAEFAVHVLGRHPDLILVEIGLAVSRRMQALMQSPAFNECYRKVADVPDDEPMIWVYARQRAREGRCSTNPQQLQAPARPIASASKTR